MNDSLLKRRVLELYTVSVADGRITHKVSKGGIKAGSVAGCIRPDGYRSVSVDNKTYLAHRLIMLISNGKMPAMVDHINGDKDDNRITNLRECDHRINSCNTKLSKANKYGYAGIRYRESRDAFEAYWAEPEGRRQKYFSCRKFGGYDQAMIAAAKYREMMIKRLSSSSMPYTDRHCASPKP